MSDVPVLVPEGKHATSLTMGELDTASRHLGADVLQCLGGEKRYGAFIELAALWAKRSGDSAKASALIERFRAYEVEDLFHALGMDRDDRADDGSDPTPPTSSSESSEFS